MIYICIPAHNEDRTIGVLLWKVRQVLANFPRDYQILVADDASTDATAEVLGPYERVLPLVVFRNSERKGYASSLEMLLREAVRRSEYPKRDVVVTLQADFTEDPEHIVAMLKRIEAGADVVLGETPLPENTLPRSYRWARRAARYLANRKKLPEGVTDALTGLRVYRVLVLKKAFDARQGRRLMTWDGWAANAELLLQVQPFSRRTETLPIGFRPDRLQRATRFDFWGTLKQAWGLSRGRAGPLENVPLQQPGHRESASHGRGRHGTRRFENVSNGGGRTDGNGQRRRTTRDAQEVRRRDPRDGRSRRDRDQQEPRSEAQRLEAQRSDGQRGEGQQRRPRRDSSGRRQEQDALTAQEGQQERRPRRERPRRESPEQRRDRAEQRREQSPRGQQPEQHLQPQLAQEDQPFDGELLETTVQEAVGAAPENGEGAPAAPRKRRRRRRSSTRKNQAAQSEMFEPAPGVLDAAGDSDDEAATAVADDGPSSESGTEGGPSKKRRRSRGRRGGRGRSRRSASGENAMEQSADVQHEQVQPAGEVPPVAPPMNEGWQ